VQLVAFGFSLLPDLGFSLLAFGYLCNSILKNAIWLKTNKQFQMKFGVVVFPGSNCDRDMQDALQNDLNQEVIMLWHKEKDLSMFSTEDCIVLPGGFSYGDYMRCGAIARFSPVMQSVIEFAQKGGKVLGVCNGFQVLCESHLLPGVLLRNANQRFICKNVYLKGVGSDRALKIPIAHGEGRFYADDATLDKLEANNQVIYRYCNENGEITAQANPNGATRNIAGICNEQRNVFGMMPHPERATSTALGNTDGRIVLQSLIMGVTAVTEKAALVNF
jgi:phosphoribosylformylglycinamidine synthase